MEGFRFNAVISRFFASAKPHVCWTVLTLLTVATLVITPARAQSRTPFVDLLPDLTFSEPSAGAPIGPVATIPLAAQVDLREQPFFSFVYSSLFQQNIDLEFQNPNGQFLVESAPTTNRVRITLPRTSGFSRLWTISLTNLLIPNVSSYQVAKLAFVNPNPNRHSLVLQALGFSENAPSPEPRISITASNGVNQLFFYNGYVRYAPDFQSGWTIIPDARNYFTNQSLGNGFFSVAPFDLPIPPVNLDTNIGGSGSGGYMNVRVRPGFQIVANQLLLTNTVGFCMNLVTAPNPLPNGTAIIKLDEPYSIVPSGASNILSSFLEAFGPVDPSRLCINLYQNGAWTDPNQTLGPGEGVIFYNPGEEFNVTFVGSHLTGTLMNYVPAGLSIRAPLIPDSGGLSTRHGYQPTAGDTVTRVSFGTVQTYTFTEDGVWDPSEPSIGSSEGVLINAKQASVWTRFFSVR